MNRKLHIALVLTCCWFLCGTAIAQTRQYSLQGLVYEKSGGIYQYQLQFSVSGDSLSGTSTTILPDSTRLTANITGTVNRVTRTFSFVETSPSELFLNGNCLFDVQLTYGTRKGYHFAAGTFTGKNLAGLPCDEGKVAMVLQEKPAFLFAPRKQKKVPATPAPKRITSDGNTRLEAGQERRIYWPGADCLLEVWDGQYADGDRITVLLNDEPILQHYLVTTQKKRIPLTLAPGTNTLTITADNDGQAPPNTAQLRLYNKQQTYQIHTHLETGKQAQVLLLRE